MKINLKKTKIMVFQKRSRKNAELRFLIDDQIYLLMLYKNTII